MSSSGSSSREQDQDRDPDQEGPRPLDHPAHLLGLEDKDLAPWRDLPVSRLLVRHLQEECEAAREAVTRFVEEGNEVAARIAVGGLRYGQALLAALHPPQRSAPPPEEPFVDPAALPPKDEPRTR